MIYALPAPGYDPNLGFLHPAGERDYRVDFGRALRIEFFHLEPCCEPPHEDPCAHLRLSGLWGEYWTHEGRQSTTIPPFAHGFTRASLSLRRGLTLSRADFPKELTSIGFKLYNWSGTRGRHPGGHIEAFEVGS